MKPDLIIQNHCLDDQSTTAELALEQFRCSFPYTNRVNVWQDGNGMTYEFRNAKNIQAVLRHAISIISTQNLPLIAKAFTNFRGDGYVMVEFEIKKENSR